MECIILCRWEVWTCQKNPCDKACQSSVVGRLVCWGSIILLCFEILKPIGWTKLSVSESLKNEILSFFMNWGFLLSDSPVIFLQLKGLEASAGI